MRPRLPPLPDLDPRRSWPGLLLLAGCGLTLVFTLLRPAASDGLTAPGRLLFWGAHVFLPLALLQGAQLALLRVAAVARLNPWVQTLLSGGLGAALFAPVALLLDRLFGLAEAEVPALPPNLPAPALPIPALPIPALPIPALPIPDARILTLLEEFAASAPAIILVWLGLNATRLIRLEPDRDPPPRALPAAPEFWSRVPRALGRDLVALSAELHYLRVRTTRGEALILYPFGRAADSAGAAGA